MAMLTVAYILLLLFASGSTKSIKSEVQCPELRSERGFVSCHFQKTRVPCNRKVRVGTIARLDCPPHFSPEPESPVECTNTGRWNYSRPRCIAVCGKRNSFVPLVVNGDVSVPGMYPWQVAIYNRLRGEYEFWCGGSLISEYSIVTAAHCAWQIPAKNLIAAFGKFFRNFDAVESHVQKIPVIRVEMLTSYQDVGGNYNGDLSVMFLERGVKINAFVKPICIDWNQEIYEKQLTDGNLGSVLGWGLTENDTFSEVLRVIQLPVKSDENCIAQQHRDFRKFVTYTSFCAGFGNGSGVCNGDSGGGLSFLDSKSDTWYLQGVVSVSPRRRGTSYCDTNFYTVFTKVTVFVKWLVRMKDLEEDLVSSLVIMSRFNGSSEGENENEVLRRKG